MSGDETHSHLRREFERIFTEDGLADVPERTAVLDAFLDTDAHVTVDQLALRLAERGTPMDKAKVAEMLQLLVGYGIARKVQFEDHPVRYEHLHLAQHHDHLICARCGRIVEVEDDELAEFQQRLAERHGFRAFRRRLELYGLCRDCRCRDVRGCPLAVAPVGEKVEVLRLPAGDDIAHRLRSMGLHPGLVVEVLQKSEHGPIILACREMRLAIDQDVAQNVMVRDAHDAPKEQEAASPSNTPPPGPRPRRRLRWRLGRRGPR